MIGKEDENKQLANKTTSCSRKVAAAVREIVSWNYWGRVCRQAWLGFSSRAGPCNSAAANANAKNIEKMRLKQRKMSVLGCLDWKRKEKKKPFLMNEIYDAKSKYHW